MILIFEKVSLIIGKWCKKGRKLQKNSAYLKRKTLVVCKGKPLDEESLKGKPSYDNIFIDGKPPKRLAGKKQWEENQNVQWSAFKQLFLPSQTLVIWLCGNFSCPEQKKYHEFELAIQQTGALLISLVSFKQIKSSLDVLNKTNLMFSMVGESKSKQLSSNGDPISMPVLFGKNKLLLSHICWSNHHDANKLINL